MKKDKKNKLFRLIGLLYGVVSMFCAVIGAIKSDIHFFIMGGICLLIMETYKFKEAKQ